MAELIVALDVPTVDSMVPVITELGPLVTFYKVGLELYSGDGPYALRPLQEAGKRIFLDLKLHDIPRTIARSVASAARHGIEMLTLHASGGRDMLRAATEAAGELGASAPRLLAVTVLTSLSDADLRELGVSRSAGEQVIKLAELAVACGVDGLVCSPLEVAALRKALGPAPLLVTPGIRLSDSSLGDQKRVGAPADTVRSGSTHLVVGRPIVEASDRSAAAAAILREIQSLR